MSSIPDDAVDVVDEEPPVNEYVRLWRSVIVQAVRDAITADHPVGYRHHYSATVLSAVVNIPLIRDKARTWLLGNSRDFVDVCCMADLDPDMVRSAARGLLSNEAKLREARRIFFSVLTGKKDRIPTYVRHLLGTSQLRDRGVGTSG
jgi:hypothetical protein